jgi:[ribosomal protein S18]-alanine N-acetyltransferase
VEKQVEMDVHIRPMELADIGVVHAIDVQSFSLPWTERSFKFEITENPSSRSWVAETADETDGQPVVVGMIVVWFILDEAHIGTIAVKPEYRLMGIGRMILDYVIDQARQASIQKIFLEVRRTNLAAQKLYEQEGFVFDGVRPHYYHDTGEDALLMHVDIG